MQHMGSMQGIVSHALFKEVLHCSMKFGGKTRATAISRVKEFPILEK